MTSDTENLLHVDIENEMKNSFLAYSMSVIVSRALPDVRDGLKPVHRRILYTMHENGLTPDKEYRKCADTVGSVLGRYHPHGDASVYDALVRLAQDFSMRYPLIDGHGNFGSLDGDPAAAYRYTESKMSKISMEMLTDINKNTITYSPNYDDRLQEPDVLPSRFPNLLVNGSVGIAVGMATNIPPHNLRETIEAIQYLIKNPDCHIEELMEYIKGPDFPTGGIIMGKSGIRAAYATGRGKITLRSKTRFEEVNGRRAIIVDEIPYMVNKKRLIENIAELIKTKRVEGIYALRDESDKDHDVRIVMELKKEANENIVLNKLFQYTQLQDTVGVILLALVRGEPKILTLKQMLEEYLGFQNEVIRKRTQFDLDKAEQRAHILEGLTIAANNIEEVVKICRESANIAEIKERLIARFDLTDVQAEAIANMRLYQLSNMEHSKITEELEALLIKIKELKEILADDNRVMQIISDELENIKNKFGDERRTEIMSISGEVDIEDLIPEEDDIVTFTSNGYIKRQAVSLYNTQKRGGRGVSGMKQRDEDFITEMFMASTHDYVMFVTDKGIMYRLKCYEIAEGGKQSKGLNIVNLLSLREDENVSAMLRVSGDENKYVVFVTKNGKIKRTPLELYKNVRKGGLRAIGLEDGDEIAKVCLTSGNDDIVIATRNGRAIRINESKVRPMSRTARGVRALKLIDDDYVVGMEVVHEGKSIMTITDKGLGRRTAPENYPVRNRGGKGLINYRVNDKKGSVCGIVSVDDNDDLMLISDEGVIIRIRVSDTREMSRYSSGVKVMRIADNGRVVSFIRVDHDDEEETAEIEQLTDEQIKAEEELAKAEEEKENSEPDDAEDIDEEEEEEADTDSESEE